MAVVSVLAHCLAPSFACAQQGGVDKAAAEVLFDRGVAAMHADEVEKGCDLFEQSLRIEPGIGAMLYLAECYEKLGKTASAWAMFREGASAAHAEGQTDRANAGYKRAARLVPKLSTITLQVAPDALTPGLEVLRDGMPVAQGLWNIGVPVDPGKHSVQARAPGHEPWTSEVDVSAEPAQLTINIPKLTAAEVVPPPPSPPPVAQPVLAPLAAPSAAPIRTDARPVTGWPVERTIGLVVGGAGIVALGTSAYFGLRAIDKNDAAKDVCPKSPNCPDERGPALTRSSQSAARLANVFAIGGAALAITGLVVYLAGGSQEAAPAVAVAADHTGARLTVGGAF